MIKVHLPIVYYAKGNALSDLDIIERPRVVKQHVFYNIDTIAPAENETYIYTSGDVFICPKPVQEVEQIIDRARAVEFITLRNN